MGEAYAKGTKMTTKKRCKICGMSKPLTEYYKAQTLDGHKSLCKPCHNRQCEERRKINAGKDTRYPHIDDKTYDQFMSSLNARM